METVVAVDELLVELATPITMESTDDYVQRQLQVRSSLALLLERQRAVAVEGPVRERFGDELRALTDAEQDSKGLKAAKRHLLFEKIIDSVQLPFPVGPAVVGDEEAPAVKDALTKSYVRRAAEAGYKDLVRK